MCSLRTSALNTVDKGSEYKVILAEKLKQKNRTTKGVGNFSVDEH